MIVHFLYLDLNALLDLGENRICCKKVEQSIYALCSRILGEKILRFSYSNDINYRNKNSNARYMVKSINSDSLLNMYRTERHTVSAYGHCTIMKQ